MPQKSDYWLSRQLVHPSKAAAGALPNISFTSTSRFYFNLPDPRMSMANSRWSIFLALS
jgi:hypothetical protein